MILHSSWRGLATAHAAPLMLLGVGALVSAEYGPDPVSLGLLVAGGVLAAVVLIDFPTSASIGPMGIERRCALRRQVIAWSAVGDIRRAPGPRFRRVGDGDGRRRAVPGGLVAACGRRRYLLVDRVEGAEEFDAVVAAVTSSAPDVPVHAARPPEGSPPTWLYRRRDRRAS